MWFILAIAAMFCWSGSDIFSKVGSKQNDKYSHWKMVSAVGLIMGIHALITILGGVRLGWADVGHYLPVSALYILSMILGYIGLRYIELSVSSPICNCSGAVTAVLCLIFLKQTLDLISAIGVIMIGVGVVALGVVEMNEDEESRRQRQLDSNRKYSKSLIALALPILYCIIDAAGSFSDTYVLDKYFNFDGGEDVANTAYELTFLAMGIAAFVYVYIIKKEKISIKYDGLKCAGGVCETVGQLAYIYALSEYAVGAAPIISAYCVLSAIWGRIFLREKLSFKHYLVITVVFAGIILLGVAEGLAE